MAKVINKIVSAAIIVLTAWLALSYMEIIVKNVKVNPEYSKGNIIVTFVNWAEENNERLK